MRRQGKKLNRWEHWHLVGFFLVAFDVVAVNLSYLLALWFRYDCTFSEINPQYLQACLYFLPVYLGLRGGVRLAETL